MKPIVKLCGFRSEADIAHLHDLPVQFAGFVLAPSKRKITINTLCKLAQLLPASVTPVAVTVNPTDGELDAVVGYAKVTTIQLHGDEDTERCRSIRNRYGPDIRIIKALPARGERTLHEMAKYGEVVDTLLIDTYQPNVRGGSGKTFQWEHIPVYQKTAQKLGFPLWIAGGLTVDNVGRLVTEHEPDGVDVSSGVERDGIKSAELMKQFVQRVRNSS